MTIRQTKLYCDCDATIRAPTILYTTYYNRRAIEQSYYKASNRCFLLCLAGCFLFCSFLRCFALLHLLLHLLLHPLRWQTTSGKSIASSALRSRYQTVNRSFGCGGSRRSSATNRSAWTTLLCTAMLDTLSLALPSWCGIRRLSVGRISCHRSGTL